MAINDNSLASILIGDVKHLTSLTESTLQKVNEMDLRYSTSMATVNKDIEHLQQRIENIEQEQESRLFTIEKEESARQAADLSISNALSTYRENQATLWEEQKALNQTIRGVHKLLWAILVTFLGLFGTFIWQLIIHGGLIGLAATLGGAP